MASMQLPELSIEIWLQIISYLYLPHLLHLALSSKRLNWIASSALSHHNQLARKYRSVNLKFDDVHSLLVSILRGELPPTYIQKLDCKTTRKDSRNSADSKALYTEVKEILSGKPGYDPWLPQRSEIKEEKGPDIRSEMAVSILLPLLTELRCLVAPVDTLFVSIGIGTIDVTKRLREQEAQDSYPNSGPTNALCVDTYPLRNLTCVVLQVSSRPIHEISEIVAWAAHPSMKRVVVRVSSPFFINNDRRALQRLENTLAYSSRPHCLEVFFVDSYIGIEFVKLLAKYWRPHCVIENLQSLDFRRENPIPESDDWARFTIFRGEDGVKNVFYEMRDRTSPTKTDEYFKQKYIELILGEGLEWEDIDDVES